MESPEDIAAEMQPSLVRENWTQTQEIVALRHHIRQLEHVYVAADGLLEEITIDGALIHSEQCFCEICVWIRRLRRVLRGATQ